jgi:hypothetical protein
MHSKRPSPVLRTNSCGLTTPNCSFFTRRKRTREYPKFSDAIPREEAPVLLADMVENGDGWLGAWL